MPRPTLSRSQRWADEAHIARCALPVGTIYSVARRLTPTHHDHRPNSLSILIGPSHLDPITQEDKAVVIQW